MKDPDASEVGKSQTKDHREQITDCNGVIDGRPLALFHGDQTRDDVGLDGNHRHGDAVVEHDDAAFALRREQCHTSKPHHHIANA